MHLRRSRLPGVVALVVALAVLPFAPQRAAADSAYLASCTVRLRTSPATTAPSLVSMPTGTVVTATGTVPGGSWSASCPASVSGDSWYAISAVNGTSVSTLFGVDVAYAAAGLFQISTAPPPTPAAYLEGIDVSHYQGTIDWAQVPGAGKRFVIMQATVGETYVDPTYATNAAGARAAGLPITAYHFAFPLTLPNDAILQADWFAQNAALLPGDLVPALDLERTGGLAPADLQAWVSTWLGEVSARLGVRPMIYTSPTFWANAMGNTTMFADQGIAVLWVAHWDTVTPTPPANNWGGQGWTFWQYSDCGRVAGITGCVDLDRFSGADLSGLRFNYGPLTPVTPPVAPTSPPVVAALVPATGLSGGGDQNISIQGSGFIPGVSAAFWNGIPMATTYISPTELAAVVAATLTATPGTGSVTILNNLPGAAAMSVPASFTVTSPVPLPVLGIGASTALGRGPAGGYTVRSPKTQAIRKYVTWKFTGGSVLAGQRANVMVARKAGDIWGSPRYLKSVWADANGIVTFSYVSSRAATINVRVQWPGNAAYGPSTSTARAAIWK